MASADQSARAGAGSEALLEGAPCALLAVDRGGRIRAAGGGALGELGLAGGALVGRTIGEALRALPWLDDALRCALAGEVGGIAQGRVGELGYRAQVTRADDGARAFVYRSISLDHVADALRESEARFRRLLENAPDLIYRFRFKPLHAFEYVSPALSTLLGYAPADCYADPYLWLALAHPDDRAELERGVPLMEAEPTCVTYRSIHKDGHVVWMEHRTVPVRDDSGELVAVEGIARDVSDVHIALAARRDAEDRLKYVVGNAPLVLFSLELDGTCTLCEGCGLESVGLRPAEVVGRTIRELYATEPLALAQFNRALAGETFTGMTPAYGRWFETRWMPLRDPLGKVSSVLGVAIDVTEQRRAERVAARIARKLELLSEASRAFVAAGLDFQGLLDTVAEWLGRMVGEGCHLTLLSSDGAWLETVAVGSADPGLRERARARVQGGSQRVDTRGVGSVVRTGRPFLLPQVARERGAVWPELRPLIEGLGIESLIVAPLRGRAEVIGTIDLFRVGPGRPYTRDDLELVMELADRASLAIENARLYRDARDAIRTRDEFLSIASHELKSPLTSLLLAVKGLEHAEASPARRASSLAIAERQGKRLASLIDRLVDVSQVGDRQMLLEPAQVDLGALVTEVAERFRGEAERTGSELQLELEPGVLGFWDALRIDQVVSNLLANAFKFGRGQPIRVGVEALGERARLTVEDHGIGIPADRRAHIFERFDRAVSWRHYQGLGLGLFLVRSIVESHGGHIELAESEVGRGSTFVVELPRLGAHGPVAHAQPGYEAPALR